MRIGELSRRSGVSIRSLRYYEEQGLLDSDRTGGGHRDYEESDLARVGFIQCLFAAGIPSRRLVDLIPFLDAGVATPGMIEHLDDEHARIEQQIAGLTSALTRLAGVRAVAEDSMAGRAPRDCALAASAAAAA